MPRSKLTAAAMALALAVTACASDKTIDGVTYKPYGLADAEYLRSDKVRYEVVWANVVWSVFCFETAFVPIWLVGWQLYEPVGPGKGCEKGSGHAAE